MTLLLLWAHEDEITVLADTLFGTASETGSEVGPKIFLVPIIVSDLRDDRRISLKNMGFAFAGNTLSGQFTHALASTCLQNLAAPTTDRKPNVAEVAAFYASCAIRIVEERRRHRALDGYGFDGVVFGHCEYASCSKAYLFSVSVDADGSCVAPLTEIALEEEIPYPIGSGAPAARDMLARHRRRRIAVDPYTFMDWIIANDEVPTVGGEVQAATSSSQGVELRPVMRFYKPEDGGMDADFAIMGINIKRLGMVAGYASIGSPLMVQSAQRLGWITEPEK